MGLWPIQLLPRRTVYPCCLVAIYLRIICVEMCAKAMLLHQRVRSAVYMMNKTGARAEHCGTPQMSWTDDPCMSRRTYCERPWRYDRKNWSMTVPDVGTKYYVRHSTVSKAADKQQRLYTASERSDKTWRTAFSLELFGRKLD